MKQFLEFTLVHLILAIIVVSYPLICTLSVLSLLYRRYFQKPKWNIEKGDVAVITGASHGLGKAFAEYLAARGCTICVVDINGRLAEEVASELQQVYKVKAKAYVTDVGVFEEVERLHKQIKKDFGSTSILINNAGVLLLSSMMDPKPKEMQNMVNVNLTAHLWTTKVFLPDMKEQNRGHILAISSIAGQMALIFGEVYSCTKFGVKGYMRSLRQTLKVLNYSNITCTTAFPFFLTTNDKVSKVIELLKISKVYPSLDSKTIVEGSMEAMLRGDPEVTLPRIFSCLIKLFEILPSESSDFMYNIFYRLFVPPDTGDQIDELLLKTA